MHRGYIIIMVRLWYSTASFVVEQHPTFPVDLAHHQFSIPDANIKYLYLHKIIRI